jgi:hypothetical protein
MSRKMKAVNNAFSKAKSNCCTRLIQFRIRTEQAYTPGGVLDNNRGSLMDGILGVIISIVIALILLEAMKHLFNVDLLPKITDNIDGMFE